jgi:hypothetical protein
VLIVEAFYRYTRQAYAPVQRLPKAGVSGSDGAAIEKPSFPNESGQI